MEKRVGVGWWGCGCQGLKGGRGMWCKGGRDGSCIALVVDWWRTWFETG